MQKQPAQQQPKNAKNLSIAFLILAVVMVGAQLINVIITLLPSAAETILQLGDGTTASVASLRNAYITSLLFLLLLYGAVAFWVYKSKNWARWVAAVLALLAAFGGVQGIARLLAGSGTDMVGLALSLAQVLAAGWVLSLAFRSDVHEWFKKQGA
ncbi:MAG: hypothetical protein HLX51_10215 [Micrococcaceae bacterium]|nr:hypothetical protein [Micrococcaceae bacterium]